MVDNLSDKFATMSEEERRRFGLQQGRSASEGDDEPAEELDFENPRTEPGRTKANLEDRDGTAALLDDRDHDKRVEEEARAREKHAPE